MSIDIDKVAEFFNTPIDDVNLPCKSCKGDCCGPDIVFSYDDLKKITKLVSIKKYKLIPGTTTMSGESIGLSVVDDDVSGQIVEGYTIQTKGVVNKKCVFLKNGKCSIYSARPKICRDFGIMKYIPCPFNGMKSVPDDEVLRKSLVKKSQEETFEIISNLTGMNFNMISADMKNVINK